jgi:hypothetical protein
MSDSPQELQLELIRVTSANEFDGARVAADLRAHRELWQAAALGPEDIGATLVYLAMDVIAAASVYILASGSDDDALMRLAEGWSASSLTWEEGVVGTETGRVLRVWWD